MTKAILILVVVGAVQLLAQSPVVIVPPGVPIQPIIDGAPSAAIIQFSPGTYRLQQIKPRSGDRYVGATAGDLRLTTLSGAKVLTGWTKSGTAWMVTGQTQQGQAYTGQEDPCQPGYLCKLPEDLWVDNVMRKRVATLGEVTAGTWYFDYAGDRIYLGEDPTGKVVETSVTPDLFVHNSLGIVNITLDSLVIEKYATPVNDSMVNLGYSPGGSANWTARNNLVRFSHAGGIGTDAQTSAVGNTVVYNCQFGFVGAGIGIRIEANEIAYNNIAAGGAGHCGYNPYYGAGGSKWVYTTGLLVLRNTSHHNWGPGLWTDINNIGTRYEGNEVWENQGNGIFHEISYDAVIVGNTLRRNGLAKAFPGWVSDAGIEVASSPNVVVTGNRLVDNSQDITGINDGRGTGIFGPWVLTNLRVSNNSTYHTEAPQPGWGYTGVIDLTGAGSFQPAAQNTYQWNAYEGANAFLWSGQDLKWPSWVGLGQDTWGTQK